MLHILVIILFISWFIFTLLNQFDFPRIHFIKKYDYFHLLPRWTFFAPNPGTSDFSFVYREMDLNGQITSFKEIPFINDRNFSDMIWNPHKRIKKAIFDLTMDLIKLNAIYKLSENEIKLSLSYIVLLQFLKRVKYLPNTKFVQFAILKTDGFFCSEKPKLIICSEFHHV